MTTIENTKSDTPRFSFDWNGFVREHITRHWALTVWLVLLTYFTITFTISRLNESLLSTVVILIVWAVSVAITVFSEVVHRHTNTTLWLKNNMYNSITNILLTLVISLGIVAAVIGLINYAFTTASFIDIPATDIRAETAPAAAGEYCFTVGAIDPDADSNALTETWNQCFPATAFSQELSDTDITAVALGEEAASFCFDTVPGDPENGITCFSSTGANPGFFTVTTEFSGANWGAVIANLTGLMVFRFDRAELWRVWGSAIFGIMLVIASFIVYRDNFKSKRIRQALTYVWLASPIIFYVLLHGVPPVEDNFMAGATRSVIFILLGVGTWWLNKYVNSRYPVELGESEFLRLGRILLTMIAGVFAFLAFLSVISLILLMFGLITEPDGSQVFPTVDPDVDWGGFLLTIIITAFAIVVSFPLGVLLALGRRSEIPGIPGWVTYPVAAIIMILGLIFSTPQLIEDARNPFETFVAYWPLGIMLLAVLFQRVWKGNVVSGFCTVYIEFIRGIPLITVLFLSIILFPIFLPPDMEVLNTWRVMAAFALFAAAYLAENVRGGLQAIPKGQYEAADSLGLSTYNKYRLIIMPQALRTVIPAITNQYIGLFKDTTLVAIVGLLDILGVANAIGAQPQWLGVRREAYIYIAVLYFVVSAVIAGYSARLEKQSGLGTR